MSGYRVTAEGWAGTALLVARRVADRRDAERLAERWMLRSDVKSASVELESVPAMPARGRRRYR